MRGVAGVVIVASLGACITDSDRPDARDNPTSVIDTTGTEFEWQCDYRCRVGLAQSTPPPPACDHDQVAGYGFAAAHFFSIMSACNSFWLEQWERPLACARDEDCPQLYEFSLEHRFECRNGLCQNTDVVAFPPERIEYIDAYLLCIAAVPRSETVAPGTAVTIDVSARVQEACPTVGAPCRLPLPAPCMNP